MTRNITLTKKILFLLSSKDKRKLIILFFLLLIGIFLEVLSIASLIPLTSTIINANAPANSLIKKLASIFYSSPKQSDFLIFSLILMISIYIIKSIYIIFSSHIQSKFSGNQVAKLSRELFEGYLYQNYSFHLKRNSAELIRNIQNETNQFASALQSLIVLFLEFSVILGLFILLFIKEPLGCLYLCLFLTISVYVYHLYTKNKLLIWGESRQKYAAIANKHLLQGLGGIKDVKLLGKENYFLQQFHNSNKIINNNNIKVNTLSLVPRSYLELLAVISLAGMLVIMIINHKPISDFVPTIGLFIASAFRIIPSFNRIMYSVSVLKFSEPVFNLLYHELNYIKLNQKFITTKKISDIKFFNKINLINLDFQYEKSKKILDKVNIEIKFGDSIAFIGPSGSGKTTLLDLILGLLVPISGKIIIDDHFDINEDLVSWQKNIGYVPQNIYLIDDSIKKNIAFGIEEKNINEKQLSQAIYDSQLKEFIDTLEDGIETNVGERGVRLSGGQKQRIGIARALYNNPNILVLDEATSALDIKTEKEVMASINKLKKMKTIIIVAHRLSTIEDCNKIYKFQDGTIIKEK